MHDPLPAHQHIRVLTKQDAEPPKAEVLGHITVKNRSASKCKYEVLIETIKQEARQIGGNYIKIIGERKPSAATSCDKIKAIILRAY